MKTFSTFSRDVIPVHNGKYNGLMTGNVVSIYHPDVPSWWSFITNDEFGGHNVPVSILVHGGVAFVETLIENGEVQKI